MQGLAETLEITETFNGIQEILQKDSLKEHIDAVKRNLDAGFYDINEGSVLRVQEKADRQKLINSLRAWPLREFLQKSASGAAGAHYLVPDKIHQIMYDSAVVADICADISIGGVINLEGEPGSTRKVDIAVDESYKPKIFMSGAQIPTETIKTTQATLDFTNAFGINFRISNDLIEDSMFDVIEMHLRNAGREMGEMASNLALTVAYVSTDGDGTLNASALVKTGDAGVTKYTGATTTDIEDLIKLILEDGYTPDLLVTTHESMFHSIMTTTGIGYHESTILNEFHKGTWPQSIGALKVIYADTSIMSNAKAFTDACKTLVMTKDYSLMTARKRWLRIENYSDPIRDLIGAAITARQDSVSIYNDATGYTYEGA